MEKVIAVIGCFLLLLNCSGSEESTYDPEFEKAEFRALTVDYLPALEEMKPYDKIFEFRNFIHQVADIGNDPLYLPFEARYFRETVNKQRMLLCQGMTFHLAAYLESYGWTYRMLELWVGTQTQGGIPYTHSVLEVWIDDHWELHDTTYNCVFVWGGEVLDTQGVKDLLDIGIYPELETSGYEQLRSFDGWADPSYWDHFNIIKKSYTQIFY
jgi:hypothetical protein